MNWEALGAIAEMIGAITIVATLLYLTASIRQNTRAVKATAVETSVTWALDFFQHQAAHPELISIMSKEFEELNPIEQGQRYMLLSGQLHVYEGYYLNYLSAVFTESLWAAKLHSLTVFLLRDPVFNIVWENSGMGYSKEFQNLVHGILAEQPDTPSQQWFPNVATVE